MTSFQISIQRTCRLLRLKRNAFYYKINNAKEVRRTHLRMKIREKALDRPRFGYRRITVLLNREGMHVSKNTVAKLYQAEGLGLKKATRKVAKRLAQSRVLPLPAKKPNDRWSIDFIYDHLLNGNRFRSLSVIDQYSRKCLAVVPQVRFSASQVTESLDVIAATVGSYPKSITSDNGPEFTSIVYDDWAKRNGVEIHLIRPGKPTENGFVESFHGKIRDECLSVNRFCSLDHARKLIAEWVFDYNNFRPHSSLKDEVPDKIWKEFQADLDFSIRTG